MKRGAYECYRIPTDKTKLHFTIENKANVDAVFPSHVGKLIQVRCQYITIDENQFDEDAVYESSLVNGPVLDFLVVQNGVAYMIQVSTQYPMSP